MTVGVSGLGEFESQVEAGALRLLAVSGAERVPGVDAPTLTEAGVDVNLENWRMVAAGPDLTPEQVAAITADIEKMAQSEGLEEGARRPRLDRPLFRRRHLPRAALGRHRGDRRDSQGQAGTAGG